MPDQSYGYTPPAAAELQFASDFYESKHYPLLKLVYGPDNGPITHVSAAAPLPLQDAAIVDSLVVARKTSTTPGADVPLAAAAAPCRWVVVTALRTNASDVAVGGPGVRASDAAQNAPLLEPGDQIIVPIKDAALVFLDVRVSGDGVSFVRGVGA